MIFEMKTFRSKPLQREPKHGSENFVRAHVLEVSSACGASIRNVFECFKFRYRGAGDLADAARCACARNCARAAREVPLRRFRSPAHLTGPFEVTFDRDCATLSNRRRSTKVPFPNIYVEIAAETTFVQKIVRKMLMKLTPDIKKVDLTL